jgi:hypothetical protein
MNETAKLEIYRAQVQNTRTLSRAWNQLKRQINLALRKGDDASAQIHTMLLALLFCAWAEANFSKLIHTPYGFEIDEIDQIKSTWSANGVGSAWNKCIELGLKRVGNIGKSNYIPNARQTLSRLVKEYIISPGLIRNKIAHGQWSVALNRENDAINHDIKRSMDNLDVVLIERWQKAHQSLSSIIEVMIESPNRAFHRDFWTELASLEKNLDIMSTWTLKSKIEKIKRKQIRPKAI